MPEDIQPPRVSGRSLKLAGIAIAAVAALVVAGGLYTRVHADQSLKTWTKDQQIPTVTLANLGGSGEKGLVLPATIEAFNTAPIHARVSGYLKRWYVDIGANVKSGQLLAEIDTPELDQQVIQARADLATAVASQKLAQTTSDRWATLLSHEFVSRQDADEKAGDLAVKISAVNGARANLDRLLATEAFKRITAPFAGVVTTRSTEIGSLISVGGPTDEALFTIADQHRLRIHVRVPQSQSAMIRPGMSAKVSVPEYPGESFTATVVTDAGAVNAANGAVLTELQLDNAAGRLKSGAYAEVSFDLTGAATTSVSLPGTAIMFRNNGPMAAVVGADSHVRIVPIVIQRDLGPTVEIGAGLKAGDKVIDNPPEALVDGDLVRVVAKAGPKTAAR